MLKRALGYQYTEVTEEESEDGFKRKVVVPDTTAQIFGLKNRKPAEWRDKQELNQSGNTTHSIKTQSNSANCRGSIFYFFTQSTHAELYYSKQLKMDV
ncbi:hypothetical protein [Peribacillus sp. S4]|uniref:hypothetical protein n=1 Tax=Peribacillus sp. S4 TaxID=3384451 RepID=UPI003988BE88